MNMSILIVDDNLSLCKALTLVLHSKGFQSDTANDGRQAIEKVNNSDFDLIFMDIRMPNLNGVEAFREIKKIAPMTQVIMMTAYTTDELIQEAIGLGVRGIIHKPISVDSIMRLIDALSKNKEDGMEDETC